MSNEEALSTLEEISRNIFIRSLESQIRCLELAQAKRDLHDGLKGPLEVLDKVARR